MQIKLITHGEHDVMFKEETPLSLGALALLRTKLFFLTTSPSSKKVGENKTKEENNLQMGRTTNATEYLHSKKSFSY